MRPLSVEKLSKVVFEHKREREAFLVAMAQGLADVKAGRVIDDDEMREQLDAEFGLLEEE